MAMPLHTKKVIGRRVIALSGIRKYRRDLTGPRLQRLVLALKSPRASMYDASVAQ